MLTLNDLKKKRNLKPANDLIKSFESSNPQKPPLKSYLCPANVWTIGHGTTVYPTGKKVGPNQTITLDEAEKYFIHDLVKFANEIENKLLKTEINDNQFCAILSLAYNVGLDIDQDTIAEGLGDSTLLKFINERQFTKASLEFPKWNKSKGVVLSGLVRRRERERILFETPILAEARPDEKIKPIENENPIFDAIRKLFEKFLQSIFGVLQPESATKPDNADTGAPFIAQPILSKGNGPRISKQRVEEILKANDVSLNSISLLIIRGYFLDSMGKKFENDRGIYDDAIIVYHTDGFYTFRGNADPSSYRFGEGTGSEKGMAQLMVGVWEYLRGMHNGSVPHMAYRQAAPVTVKRDRKGGGSYKDTGWFGINIHRGGVNGTSSLGCVTVPPAQWPEFDSLLSGKLAEKNQKTFKVCLVNETDLRNGVLKIPKQ